MPIIQQKTHDATPYSMLTIKQPGFGGLNLEDLDFTLSLNQSPDMQNTMYKNGIFGKRYGQSEVKKIGSGIYSMHYYSGRIFMQCADGHIYSWDGSKADKKDEFFGLSKKGFFFTFSKTLYFLSSEHYMKYGDGKFSEVEPYAPDILVNLNPDGSSGSTVDAYNMLGGWVQNTFHGDGKSTLYQLSEKNLGDGKIKVTYHDDKDGTHDWVEGDGNFTVDRTAGTINFKTAPVKGNLNVLVKFEQNHKDSEEQREELMKCTMAIAFGGANNSHLFLAGNGTSKYYYSDTVDPSYFPETNYAVVGNTEDDITGFGLQYNVLIVFKPTEIFQLTYQYEMNSTTKKNEVTFYSQPVNTQIGCNMPNTIQYIDNRLTWGSTDWGICTLCSTVIQDERNVRTISRNINGGERKSGLLAEPNLKDAIAVDYEGKYIVYANNHAWVWDYQNAPYSDSSRYTIDELAKATAWFYWNNIGYHRKPITDFIVIDHTLYFASDTSICQMDTSLDDFGEAIDAYYQTPMLDFQAFESLKTIKKVFFEVRGDATCNTQITYLTDEDPDGEVDPENIIVNGILWGSFSWDNFKWIFNTFSKTIARKCSVKKVELFGCKISNNEPDNDMDIASMKFEYKVVKEIK